MRVKGKITRFVNKPDSCVKAIASATFDEHYAVHGIKICDGKNGLFISMPSSQANINGEKKYQDTFHPISKGAHEALIAAVFDAYDMVYDNLNACRELVKRQIPNIAKNQTIDMHNLKWYAAFHDKTSNPHVHIIVY